MHNTITLDTIDNRSDDIALNWLADLLVVQNLTAESILVRIGALDKPNDVDGSDIYVPPFTSVTHSVTSNQFGFSFGFPKVSPVPSGSPTTAILTFSKDEPVPTFSGMPITSTNATIVGSIDANVTNASLNTNSNITNASLPVDANITNATLSTNSNITNASLPVDANITNANLNANVTNPSLNTNVTNTGFDANVTNASLNANIINASIPVTGTINATIQNANIDTNVLNAAIPAASYSIHMLQFVTGAAGDIENINITIPENVSGFAIASNTGINNYDITIQDINNILNKITIYQESTQPQPQMKLIPVIKENNKNNFNFKLTDNVGGHTFDLYGIVGSFPVVIQPSNGFIRQQVNILNTGFMNYQANIATGGTTDERGRIPAPPSNTVLVIDYIFSDVGPNSTNVFAAYLRLQQSFPTSPSVILYEHWSSTDNTSIVHHFLTGPIYYSQGYDIIMYTHNSSSSVVLMSFYISYHYQSI